MLSKTKNLQDMPDFHQEINEHQELLSKPAGSSGKRRSTSVD